MKVIFEDHLGQTTEVNSESGVSLMRVAVDNGIDGIVAECGGTCSCATCHCYVDEAWMTSLETLDPMENRILEGVIDRRPNSRLSCQIKLHKGLDGLKVVLPESQY